MGAGAGEGEAGVVPPSVSALCDMLFGPCGETTSAEVRETTLPDVEACLIAFVMFSYVVSCLSSCRRSCATWTAARTSRPRLRREASWRRCCWGAPPDPHAMGLTTTIDT